MYPSPNSGPRNKLMDVFIVDISVSHFAPSFIADISMRRRTGVLYNFLRTFSLGKVKGPH